MTFFFKILVNAYKHKYKLFKVFLFEHVGRNTLKSLYLCLYALTKIVKISKSNISS